MKVKISVIIKFGILYIHSRNKAKIYLALIRIDTSNKAHVVIEAAHNALINSSLEVKWYPLVAHFVKPKHNLLIWQAHTVTFFNAINWNS